MIAEKGLRKIREWMESTSKASGDKLWSVSCVVDGFSMKLYLDFGKRKRKTILSYGFGLLYNGIDLILNKYLPLNSEYSYRLPFSVSNLEEL